MEPSAGADAFRRERSETGCTFVTEADPGGHAKAGAGALVAGGGTRP
jgi:hypothetical protein